MLRSAFALIGVGLLVACSSGSPTRSTPDDAGRGGDDAGVHTDGGAGDATDAGLVPTKRTSLEVTIEGVVRTLDIGQFVRETGDGGEVLYIESHEGGERTCPTDDSPTPDRTLIVSGVPVGAPGDVFTKADGVGIGLLDFAGDLLPDGPVAGATAATVTIVAIDGTSSAEIEVDATFDRGTAKGRIHTIYCESLSNRPKP